MQKLTAILFLLAAAFTAKAQHIEVYNAERLLQRVSNEDTFYVVNFWATWCGPCVKELPEFERLQKHYNGKPVKILLVSLDFKEAYPRKIESFLQKKRPPHEVVWFNETNANEFIPKIDNRWQGSIPATWLVYRKQSYTNFVEGMTTAERLATLIDKQLALE
jgi:thiol-disulfide isomerase/thioredoxin